MQVSNDGTMFGTIEWSTVCFVWAWTSAMICGEGDGDLRAPLSCRCAHRCLPSHAYNKITSSPCGLPAVTIIAGTQAQTPTIYFQWTAPGRYLGLPHAPPIPGPKHALGDTIKASLFTTTWELHSRTAAYMFVSISIASA
eukprot:4253187-Amphidinium_carterae.3